MMLARATVADDGVGSDGLDVRSEYEVGLARIVIGGVLTAAASAAAQEMLLEACERDPARVVLAVEAELDPTDHDVLRYLVDVAQRRCWTASCQLEVIVTDPEVSGILADAGIAHSAPGAADAQA